MQAVLNVVEDMVMESLDEKGRDEFRNQLYRPVEGQTPEGFDRESQMASMTQFEAMWE